MADIKPKDGNTLRHLGLAFHTNIQWNAYVESNPRSVIVLYQIVFSPEYILHPYISTIRPHIEYWGYI